MGVAVLAALGAALCACTNEVEEVSAAATSASTADITVADFPAFSEPQTRATSEGRNDKTSWEEGDKIYIQLNGKGPWYTLEYDGTQWASTDLPDLSREDKYEALYAPNYEPSGDELTLKEDAVAGTAEYLKCEGSKPITISFKRDYARIRFYTGEQADFKVNVSGSFKTNDGYTFGDAIHEFELSPDEYGNAYIYGTWGDGDAMIAYGNTYSDISSPFSISPNPNGSSIKTASVANKSYVMGPTYVVLDIDKAYTECYSSYDWDKFANQGLVNVKVKGEWLSGSDYNPSFGSNSRAGQKLKRIDVSGVTNMGTIPSGFFKSCKVMTEVKLPLDVTTISQYVFENCYCLTKIEIPASVNTIEGQSFSYCSKLSEIVCYATTPPELGWGAFDFIASNRSLYVPDSAVKAYQTDTSWSPVFGEKIYPISALSNE